METLFQDLRYGLRQLRKSPGFAFTAVFTLALTVGVATAVFCVIDDVILRPLPYPHPERILAVDSRSRSGYTQPASWPSYTDERAQTRAFAALAGYMDYSKVTLETPSSRPVFLPNVRSTDNFFQVFGVQPLFGRTYLPGEEQDGKNDLAVLSYELWQSYFAGDRNVLNRSIKLDGRSYTVIGVMPFGFRFPLNMRNTVYTPLHIDKSWMLGRGNHWLRTVARLKDGVTIGQAQADLAQVFVNLGRAFPGLHFQGCQRGVLMRVLLSTIGSRGDVQPLVALALQLRALGQEVRLCVPPDFRDWVDSLGIPVTPIGPELRKLTSSSPPVTSGPPSPERRRQLAEATVDTQFERIAVAAQGCDIIVAATALQIAARSVAEGMGIPYVFAAYCPIVLPSPHHAPPPLPPLPGQTSAPVTEDSRGLWARDAERFNDLFGAALGSHRASLGLTPVSDVRSHVFTDRPWLAADPTLAPWPDPADQTVFQTGAWILRDERSLSPEVKTFLETGEPPVYFGFGSMRVAQDLSQMIVQAARALRRRAIVSRGWADLSPVNTGPDCLVVGEVNLQALFKRVAAVVHHGGAGTTTTAALAGAPQVIIAQMYDQHYWAQRIDDLGIGTAHASGTPTTDSLTSALEHTLQPEVAARAQSIATAVRSDGAQAAAQRLIIGFPQNSL